MSKLFRKQKAEKLNKRFLLQSVETHCNTQLQKFASYISDKAQRIPQQLLAWILISACLITAFALTCKLFYSFKHKGQIEIHSITAPAVKSFLFSPIDDDVFRRIKKFHHYLDSLKKNDLPVYDSIMTARPHMMDSLITIEEFTNQ